MKHFFLFLAFCLLVVPAFLFANPQDTVWTLPLGMMNTVKFSPNDQYVVMTPLQVRNTSDGGLVWTKQNYSVGGFDFSHDGNYIITSHSDRPILRKWNLLTGDSVGVYLDTFQIPNNLQLLRQVSVSPDGSKIAVAYKNNPLTPVPTNELILILDYETGEVIKELTPDFAGFVKFSPDGKYIAYDSYNGYIFAKNVKDYIRLLDATTYNQIGELEGDTIANNDFTFSPDGNYLGVAKMGGTANVWDIKSKEIHQKLKNGVSAFTLAFPHMLNFILIGSVEYTNALTRIFNINTKEVIYDYTWLDSLDRANSLAISLDDNYIIIGGEFGIYLLNANWNPSSVPDVNQSKSEILYPNPTNGKINIAFNLPKSENVNISVYDDIGNLIDNVIDKYLDKGDQNIEYTNNTILYGNYIVTILSESYAKSFKLIINK